MSVRCPGTKSLRRSFFVAPWVGKSRFVTFFFLTLSIESTSLDSFMLRQRNNNNNKTALLPQHQGQRLVNPSSSSRRKKKTRRQRRRVSLAALCCLVVVGSLVVLLLFGESVPTSHPVLHRARNFTKHHVNRIIHKVKQQQQQQQRDAGVAATAASSKPTFPTITCGDGITIGYLNDNYCDCRDNGADEPLTDACADVTVAKLTFTCHNHHNDDDDHAEPLRIFASRVHDGIWDCPDGSDEA